MQPQDDDFSGPALDSKWSFLERSGSPDLGYSFTANPGNITIHVKPESRNNQVSDITRLIQDTIHQDYVLELGITASGIASVGHESGILIVENNTTFIFFVKSQQVAGSRLRVYSAAGGAPALIDEVTFTDDTSIVLRVQKYSGNFKFFYKRAEDSSFTQTPTTVSAAAYGYGAGTSRYVGLGAVAGDAGALAFDYLADHFTFHRLMDVETNGNVELRVTNTKQTNGNIAIYIHSYPPVVSLEVRQHFEIPANTLLWVNPSASGYLQTIVVRKAGSYPKNVSDGTLVVTVGSKNIVFGELPIGIIDGSNPSFSLADTPNPNTKNWVAVFSDGIRVDLDQYDISGTDFEFVPGSVNIPGNTLTVDYPTTPLFDPIIWGEVPIGTIDGSNNSFLLNETPANGDSHSANVFSDGIHVEPDQYVLMGKQLVFNPESLNIPVKSLVVDYVYGSGVLELSLNERPDGIIDGSNDTFVLSQNPVPAATAAVALYSDGIRVDPSDYSLVGKTITIFGVNIPVKSLRVDYRFLEAATNSYLDYVPSAFTRWYYAAFAVYSYKTTYPTCDATLPVFVNLYKNVGSRFSKKFQGYVWWTLYSVARIIQYLVDSDIAQAWAQFNVNTATGYFLDVWGRIFGTRRFPSETDRVYSSRVISRVIQPRTVIKTIVGEVLKIPNVVSCEILDATRGGMFIGHSFIGFDAPTEMETRGDFITYLAQDNPFFFTVRVVIRTGASLDQIVKAISDNKAGGTTFAVEIVDILP